MGLVSKYKRGGVWYLSFSRKIGGTRQSLGTSDAKVAEMIRVKQEHDILFHQNGIQTITPTRLHTFREEYLAFKRGQGRSEATLCCYNVAFNNFEKFLGEDLLVDQITAEHIEAFGAKRREVPPKDAKDTRGQRKKAATEKTILNEVVALLTAFTWGVRRHYLRLNPVAESELPRPVKHPPRYLRREDYTKLMAKVDNEDFRDVIMFYLLTGCRRGEGIDLKIREHIDLERKTITIPQRKQKDYKTIPISDALLPVVKRLMLRAGKSDRLIPFHEDTLTTWFRDYAKAAGLAPEITFHALRHTFGTWLASEGVSFTTIQILMGHRDAESTKHYVHAYNEDLTRAIDKLKLPLN